MSKKTTPKKTVFSEEVDSRIDGLTLGLSFIAVGLLLLFVPDYFGSKLAGQIVRWIFIVIGALGLLIEFAKFKPISTIKGFDDLWVGVLFLAGWVALYYLTHNWLWSIGGFFLLIIGAYGAFRGLLRIIYSLWLNQKFKTQTKGTIISDIIIFCTKVVSLTLVVVQLINALHQ